MSEPAGQHVFVELADEFIRRDDAIDEIRCIQERKFKRRRAERQEEVSRCGDNLVKSIEGWGGG